MVPSTIQALTGVAALAANISAEQQKIALSPGERRRGPLGHV